MNLYRLVIVKPEAILLLQPRLLEKTLAKAKKKVKPIKKGKTVIRDKKIINKVKKSRRWKPKNILL